VIAISQSMSNGSTAGPAAISASSGTQGGASGTQTFALMLAGAQVSPMPSDSPGSAPYGQKGLAVDGGEISPIPGSGTSGAGSQSRKAGNALPNTTPSMPFSFANAALMMVAPPVIPQLSLAPALAQTVASQPTPEQLAVTQFAVATTGALQSAGTKYRLEQFDSSAPNAAPSASSMSGLAQPGIAPAKLGGISVPSSGSSTGTIQANLPTASPAAQTQEPEIRAEGTTTLPQANSFSDSSVAQILVSSTSGQSFSTNGSQTNATGLQNPVVQNASRVDFETESPQRVATAESLAPSDPQATTLAETSSISPVPNSSEDDRMVDNQTAPLAAQFGVQSQSVATSSTASTASGNPWATRTEASSASTGTTTQTIVVSHPDPAFPQSDAADNGASGTLVPQTAAIESVSEDDVTAQSPGKTSLPGVEGVQFLVPSVSDPAQNMATARMTPLVSAAPPVPDATQAAHLAAPASAAAPASQPANPHLVIPSESVGSKEWTVNRATPFSVFFSDPAAATESAASTLPKMILPPSNSTIPTNHTLVAPANPASSTTEQGIKPAAAPQNSKQSSAGSDSGNSPNTQSPRTNVDANLAVEALMPQSSTGPAPVTASSAGAALAASAPPNSNSLPQPQALAAPSSGAPPAAPPALPEPAAVGPVQAAQIVNRLGQSEMRVGLNTTAFGGVEVRTVIHTSDVGVIIGSEKGDLRALLANDLPAIANTLQQQNLRLSSVNFMQGFASSSNGSGGGSQSRSFTPPSALVDSASPESTGETSADAPAYAAWSGGGNLSILA
jgi:hypothetical protein